MSSRRRPRRAPPASTTLGGDNEKPTVPRETTDATDVVASKPSGGVGAATWFSIIAIVLVGIVVVGLVVFSINTHRRVKTISTQQESQNPTTLQATIRKEIEANNKNMKMALGEFEHTVASQIQDIRTRTMPAPQPQPQPKPQPPLEFEDEDEGEGEPAAIPVASVLAFVSASNVTEDPPISDRVEAVEESGSSFGDIAL